MIAFIRCNRANTAVEFAMLLPIFITMLFGIVIFGSYFAVVHGVQQLAAEAARSSIAGLNESERGSIAASYVVANAGTYPLLDPAYLTVRAASSGSGGNIFVVTVNYDTSTMFIRTLPGPFAPPTVIARSAAIPFGGF